MYEIKPLSGFSLRNLIAAEAIERKYTFYYWIASVLLLGICLFLSFYFLNYQNTLFQIASSFYTTILIEFFVELILTYENYKIKHKVELDWKKIIFNLILVIITGVIAYFSDSSYADNLIAILFSIVASVAFYVIRTNLFQNYSEYQALLKYENLVEKLDNSMSTGLSAGYYINFIKQVLTILQDNNFVVTNEVDKQQYDISGILIFIHLDHPDLKSNFENIFDLKKELQANYQIKKLEIATKKRNFIADLIQYDGKYYIFDIPTPINVLVKMSLVLENEDIEFKDEVNNFFVKLQLYYSIDFPEQSKISLLIPPYQIPLSPTSSEKEKTT